MSLGAPDPDLYRLADQYDGVAGPAPANAAPAPMPEPVVQPVEPGGLDSFDADAAAQNLAAVGQAPAAPAPGPDAPMAPTPTAPAAVVPEAAPVDPLSVAEPPRPALTGDPAKDTAANLQWQRDLSDHYAAREQELTKRATSVNAEKAAKEVEIAKEAAKQHMALRARQQAERAAAQKQIDDAVAGRAAAAKDLEGANWADQHTGRAIVATIFGALAAGFQNMGAAYLGQVGHAENEGAKAVDRMIQRDYEIKKQRIASMSEALLEARHGYQDLAENQRAAMNDLDADTSVKYKLVAKEAEDRLRQMGASEEDIKRNAFVANAKAQAAKTEAQILDREQTHQDTREGHEAANNLAKAHLDLQERQIRATEGDRRDNRYERRREFDLRDAERKDALREKADKDKEKAAEKKAAEDSKLEVRDGEGRVRGYASSPRNVKPIEDRIVQYDDAIKSLEDLKASGDVLPMGARYDRAVLAVAATTQANASDKTTTHEANSIKNWGVISTKAIDDTLAHLRERQAKFMKQLRPVEGGDAEKGSDSGPTPKQKAAMERLAKEYGLTPVTP